MEIRAGDQPAELLHRVGVYRSFVAALAFHPAGAWFAASDERGQVSLVDASTGSIIAQTTAAPDATVQSLMFDPSGERLLVSRGDALAIVSTDPDDWAELARGMSGLSSVPSL